MQSNNMRITKRKVAGLLLLIVFVLVFIFSCTSSVLPLGRILVGTFGYMIYPLSLFLSLISLALFLGFSYKRRVKPTILLILAISSVLLVIHSIAGYGALSKVANFETLKVYLGQNYNNFTLLGSFGSVFSGLIAMAISAMGAIVAFVILATIMIGLLVDYEFYGKYEKPQIRELKTRKMREKVSNSDKNVVNDNKPSYSFESQNQKGNDEILSEVSVDANSYASGEGTNYSRDDVVGEITNDDIDTAGSPQYSSYGSQPNYFGGDVSYDSAYGGQTQNSFEENNFGQQDNVPNVYDYDANAERRRFMHDTFGHSAPTEEQVQAEETQNYSDFSQTISASNGKTDAYGFPLQKPDDEPDSEIQPQQTAANFEPDEEEDADTFHFGGVQSDESSDEGSIDDELTKILNSSEDDIDREVKEDYSSNVGSSLNLANSKPTSFDFEDDQEDSFEPQNLGEQPSKNTESIANNNVQSAAKKEDWRSAFSPTRQTPPTEGPGSAFGQSGEGEAKPQNNNGGFGQNVGLGGQPKQSFGFNGPAPAATNGFMAGNVSNSAPSSGFGTQSNSIPSSGFGTQSNSNSSSGFGTQSAPNKVVVPAAKEQKKPYSFNIGLPGVRYNPPPLTLLRAPKPDNGDYTEEQTRKSAQLENVLSAFNIPAKVKNIVRGPKITRYELSVPLGVSVKRIPSFENDIAAALAAKTITIKAPIPGSSYVGIELENDTFTSVYLRELLESDAFQNFKDPLPIAIGKDISGEIVVKSLAKMVHLLIAGSTGSGKSVFIHNIVMSLIYKSSPDELRLIMIDPKKVEFNRYNGLPHLMTPEVVMGADKAINALKWAVKEMDRRYDLMSRAGHNNIEPYNKCELVKAGQFERFPYIVIIVDELAEIMMANKKEVEACIQRITQLARACGMHLILATQRPSVDIISGVIKNNVPSRIAFSLQSGIDSKTILNAVGAEKLLGQGDMIFAPTGTSVTPRLQAAYATDEEIKAVIDYDKKYNNANFDETVDSIINSEEQSAPDDAGGMGGDGFASKDTVDNYFKTALKLVMQNGGASVSYLQRRLSIGYSRAARIIDQMEDKGYIAGATGSKVRKVLITPDQFREEFGEEYNDIND